MPAIEKAFKDLRAYNVRCETFNCDALNSEKREQILATFKKTLGSTATIQVIVHSIAKGNLKPMTGETSLLSREDLLLTLEAMAVSLYEWSSDLVRLKLLDQDTRIVSFTSEGSSRVLPYYGAVGAAKAALESISRNMAVEWASLGIKVNCIQAGVTETESFARIPNSEQIREHALKRNPSGRLTRPSDVANAVYLLTRKEAEWITGTVIKVDGGESLK